MKTQTDIKTDGRFDKL